MKKGTLKFYLNSVTNTLPTGNNLLQWGKATSDHCKLCKNRETTFHVLYGCKVSLEQGKYTWRHDSILKYISDGLDDSKFDCYVDIPGKQKPNGGTVALQDLPDVSSSPNFFNIDARIKLFNYFFMYGKFVVHCNHLFPTLHPPYVLART